MKEPVYRKILNELRNRIMTGVYIHGDKFPGRVLISREFGVCSITAVRVIKELTNEGLIKSRKGTGSIVNRSSELTELTIIHPAPESGLDMRYYLYAYGCISRCKESSISYNLQVFGDPVELQEIITSLPANHGVIYIYIGPEIFGITKILQKSNNCIVHIENTSGKDELSVAPDYYNCVKELVTTMIADGYSTIGFIGNLQAQNHRICRDAYLYAIKKLKLDSRYIRDATEKTVPEAVVDLMSTQPVPDALVIIGGMMPIKALPVILQNYPRVRLGCVDESPLIAQLSSTAYIASFSMEKTGSMAVDMLKDAFANRITSFADRYSEFTITKPSD